MIFLDENENTIRKHRIIMKVLLINGSPRKQGNTFTALSEAAKQLEKNGIETEIVWIGTSLYAGV